MDLNSAGIAWCKKRAGGGRVVLAAVLAAAPATRVGIGVSEPEEPKPVRWARPTTTYNTANNDPRTRTPPTTTAGVGEWTKEEDETVMRLVGLYGPTR